MRILLIHPPFSEPFWGNGYFNVLSKENRSIMPPLGLLTVAALLPEDWTFRMADMLIEGVSDRDLSDHDVIMITGLSNQDIEIKELISRAKGRKEFVVVGGAWASHNTQTALDLGADIVVRGEAEPIAQALVAAVEGKQSGKVFEAEERTDMTRVPVPRFDLIDMKDYYVMPIQFARGCPFDCEFCAVPNMLGNRVRTKTSDQMIGELQAIYELGFRGLIFVSDDNFIGNPSRTKAMLRDLVPWLQTKRMPFEFVTQASANLAQDDELMDLMVRAGFVTVCLGIESTEASVLQSIGKQHNVSIDLDVACRKLNQAGLAIMTSFIIGFDGEMAGVDKRVIDFVERNQIPEAAIQPLRATPGTKLWERLQREGRLLPDSTSGVGNPTGLVNFLATRPREEIAREMLNVIMRLHESGGFLQRTFRCIANMRRRRLGTGLSWTSWGHVRLALSVIRWQGWTYRSRWRFWLLFAKTLLLYPRKMPLYLRLAAHGVAWHEGGKVAVKEVTRQIEELSAPVH